MGKEEIIKLIFSESEFNIIKNERLLPNSWKKQTIDYVIYNRNSNEPEPFAVVVFTTSGINKISLAYAKQIVKQVVSDSVFWFGLVINNKEEINLFSTSDGPQHFSWKKNKLIEIKSIVEKYMTIKFDKEAFLSQAHLILSSLKPESDRENLILKILSQELKNLNYHAYGRTVSSDLQGQFSIVQKLLNDIGIKPCTHFCRYTSAASLHRILTNQEESMCGLAVMNDKSEGFFLDKCISPTSSINIWTRPQREIDAYNNSFITSLCDRQKSDNLTMWRLYGGNDGDGVCLEYDIDVEFLSKCDNFQLMPVLYGKANNLLIQLFRLLGRIPFIGGFQFVFSYKNILRYFVKPEEFGIEEEYRLLYIHKGFHNESIKHNIPKPQWIFNSYYNIFHPLIELKWQSGSQYIYSPLILKSIILGPKCHESKVNKVQLRAWINQLGLSNITVKESAIDFYR